MLQVSGLMKNGTSKAFAGRHEQGEQDLRDMSQLLPGKLNVGSRWHTPLEGDYGERNRGFQ